MPKPMSGKQQRQPKPASSANTAERRASAVEGRLLDRTREFIRSIAAQMGARRRNVDWMNRTR